MYYSSNDTTLIACDAGFCSQQVQDITALAGQVRDAMSSKYQLNKEGKSPRLLTCLGISYLCISLCTPLHVKQAWHM